MEPLVICAAITGGCPPEGRSAGHPLTPKAIAEEALRAWQAGAAVVHCHARLEDGTPTNDAGAYRDLLARIRDRGCKAVINFSAGDNGGLSNDEERLSVVGTGADIVSLGGGSFNIGNRVYANAPAFRLRMAQAMRAAGVVPEFELFDLGQFEGLRVLGEAKLVPDAPLVTLVTGSPGAMPADLDVIRAAVALLPRQAQWSIACQTPSFELHRKVLLTGFALGSHIRTGMEDCALVRADVTARSNAELVDLWVRTAQTWGRPLASADDLRARLRLH